MTISYYDVLDVDQQASTDEIRAAWRSAVADLDPTDRRFRAYNNAAEVLLDPDRRAAHDAELAVAAESAEEPTTAEPVAVGSGGAAADASSAATGTEPAPSDAPAADASDGAVPETGADDTATDDTATDDTVTEAQEPAQESTAAAAGGAASGRRTAPTWLLVALAVATVVVAGVAVWLWVAVPSDDTVSDASSEARATAERAIVPVLSYDASDLETSRSNAEQHLTEDFGEEYAQIFDGIVERNAPNTGTTVEAEFVASGLARADPANPYRVQVLLFVDQAVTNEQRSEPVVNRNQVTVTMQRVDGEWLIDGLRTSPLPE